MQQATDKNILVISPCPTHPATAGNRKRILNVCQKFKDSGYRVHFLWFAIDQGGMIHPDHMQAMQNAWDLVHVVNVDSSLNLGKIDQTSLDVDRFWSDQIHHAIDWLKLQYRYDIMWVNYAFYSRAFEQLDHTDCIGILDTHDALSRRPVTPLPRPAFCVDKEGETQALNRADIVLAIQDDERAYFSASCSQPVMTLSHLEIGHSCAPTGENEHPVRIGLIGSTYPPSVQSAQDFLDALANQMESVAQPAFKLLVAGPQCAALVIPEELAPITQCLGVIDDLASFYCNIDLAANPVQSGTGLKIKTVEALAHGRPIIGTREAFAGLNSAEPYHGLQNPQHCARVITELVQSPSRLGALNAAGQQIFAAYQKRCEGEWQTLLSMASTVREQKSGTPFYSGSHIFCEFSQLYIYGAGSGMYALMRSIGTGEKKKITAFIDQSKAGQSHAGIPILHPDELMPPQNETAVIITVLSPEWENIFIKLQATGFKNIFPAHQFLVTNHLV